MFLSEADMFTCNVVIHRIFVEISGKILKLNLPVPAPEGGFFGLLPMGRCVDETPKSASLTPKA
jgi:hypothetical protein